ncbi:MAG: glycerate kinase [Phaeodactylibacter sp.]|nr:glycerate kinase [Phaeodactylibacter sp.]
MNVLIAADSFKDSLAAPQVCQAIQRGVQLAAPDAATQILPLADGGEGTARILTDHLHGQWIEIEVSDPLFRPIRAGYGLSADGKTAFIDMAQASGLELLAPDERDPLLTTSYGTGQLIQHAKEQGAEKILLGIGGSATNDAGMGMAIALGYSFLDEEGFALQGVGGNLIHIRTIRPPVHLDLPQIDVLCDVQNPLYGPQGAAHVFAAQKGAGPLAIEQLDEGLQHLTQIWPPHTGPQLALEPGTGAAGGLGFGTRAFLNATLRPGIATILELLHFEEALKQCDLLLTGEGRIDEQTLQGKLIKGLTFIAANYNKPVVALCGSLQADPATIKRLGLKAAFSILRQPTDLQTALKHTAADLEHLAFNIIRIMK